MYHSMLMARPLLVAGVAPGLERIPAEWSTYYLYVATIAATLAGLSFVAVSVHPPVLQDVGYRRMAQRALTSFVIVLVMALSLARPGAFAVELTGALFYASATNLFTHLITIAMVSGWRRPRVWLRHLLNFYSIAPIAAYIYVIVWSLLHWPVTATPAGPSDVATYMIVLLTWSLATSWRLFMTGVRSKHLQPDAKDSRRGQANGALFTSIQRVFQRFPTPTAPRMRKLPVVRRSAEPTSRSGPRVTRDGGAPSITGRLRRRSASTSRSKPQL